MNSTAPTTPSEASAAPQLRIYAIGAVIARTMLDASAMARRQGTPAPGMVGG